jgi:23S rRNA pseudouridine1911/1915/1917 synthase
LLRHSSVFCIVIDRYLVFIVMATKIQDSATVPSELDGARFDQAAAQLFPDYSRSRLKKWIQDGELQVDGRSLRPRDPVDEGAKLVLDTELEEQERWLPEAIALDVVYEDDHILVVNKPAGLVVHPGAGNGDGTMLNAILHHCPANSEIPRAGIVHRLDKDTTGLMVVAKTLQAQTDLVEQLRERSVSREYWAIAQGVMTAGGKIDKPIGRHPRNRQKMGVLEFGGKEAITHYRVLKRMRAHTLVCCKLETGRTHQIRVHLADRRYPLVGDTLYAGREKLPKGASEELIGLLRGFKRQALHAKILGLVHPYTHEDMEWEVPLPEDFETLLNELLRDTKEAQML